MFVDPPLPSHPMSSNSATLQISSRFYLHDTLHKQPWHAALVVSVGALVVSSRLVALVIRLSSALFFFSAPWVSLYLSR